VLQNAENRPKTGHKKEKRRDVRRESSPIQLTTFIPPENSNAGAVPNATIFSAVFDSLSV
jgi:hypothetical protein